VFRVRGAFKHLGVVAGIQLGATTIHNQKKAIINHIIKDLLKVFKGAFKHLGVVMDIQLRVGTTTIHNQMKVVINTLYNADPFSSVTGKATTVTMIATARTNATESLILTMFNKKA
jgi:hypothetical protein